jgi:uncharacterized membrane protein YgdD (TMEM256/DUF423 family)
MVYRLWLFLAGLAGGTAVMAGAYGAHALNGVTTFSAPVKIYEIGALYHAVHAIALTLTAVLLAATEGRRGFFANLMLNLAALAFLAGIILFSGGIYYQILRGGFDTGSPIVPAGGFLFIGGWAALALSAFGFRRPRGEPEAQA